MLVAVLTCMFACVSSFASPIEGAPFVCGMGTVHEDRVVKLETRVGMLFFVVNLLAALGLHVCAAQSLCCRKALGRMQRKHGSSHLCSFGVWCCIGVVSL